MKIVIDTNIWISYLLGSLLQGLDNKILSKEIRIVVSNEMLKELAAVLARPKFKEIISYKQIKELFSLIDGYAVIVSPKQKVDVCRDKKDNFLLEVALEAKAEYLVTGDNDLLVLNNFRGIKIVKPKDFEEMSGIIQV